MVKTMQKKIESMNKEFDFLKSELEEKEGNVKNLQREKESLQLQIKDLKE